MFYLFQGRSGPPFWVFGEAVQQPLMHAAPTSKTSRKCASLVFPKKGPRWAELSNEKHPGGLVYMGDEKLPSFIGIIINHYKDPFQGFTLPETNSKKPLKNRGAPWKFGDSELGSDPFFRGKLGSFREW